jgi:dipeptidyl aminopeptidase/acylaminoacyl peptidase
LTVETLWSLSRPGRPELSPDGRWAVVPITRFDREKNRGNTDLWRFDLVGSEPPRQLTFNEENDSAPVFRPDGRFLAFVSKRGDSPAQLYLLPWDGGEAERLTELPVAVGAPKWSPDGRFLIFPAATYPDLGSDWQKVRERIQQEKDDRVQAKISETRIVRIWDRYATDGRFYHFFRLDLATRQVEDLTPGLSLWTQLEGEPEWDLAPDGRELVFSANVTEPPYRSLNFDLLALPLDGEGRPAGPLRNLTAGHEPDDLAPRYAPDGRVILFRRHRRAQHPADFARLALLDRAIGRIQELDPSWDAAPTLEGFDAQGNLLLLVEERGRVHLVRKPLTDARRSVLVRGGRVQSAVAKGKRIVFVQSSFLEPPELWVMDEKGVRQLTRENSELLARTVSVTVEEFETPGSQGERVHGFLVLPPNFRPDGSFPLLFFLHGGPHLAFLDEFNFRWNARLAASRGYVVALPNFHGSTGYGQAFAESIVGDHATRPFADVMAWTDALLERGYGAADRLFAAGASYGGFLINWILGSTDRFRALISHAGVYDHPSQFASDWVWARPAAYGAAPWEDYERTQRFSPSRQAANFRTPTLILHGEKDYRVPIAQGLELYGVLQGKGVPSKIVIFPDENHWILKPQAAELWWREFFSWIERFDPQKAETESNSQK